MELFKRGKKAEKQGRSGKTLISLKENYYVKYAIDDIKNHK